MGGSAPGAHTLSQLPLPTYTRPPGSPSGHGEHAAYSPSHESSVPQSHIRDALHARHPPPAAAAAGMKPGVHTCAQPATKRAPAGAAGQGTHVGSCARSCRGTQSVERLKPGCVHMYVEQGTQPHPPAK